MRGKKEVFWAVVISAALVTAGLTLNCGDENDDENGGAAVVCQDACEKLKACLGDPYPFGYTVAECVEACEEELAGGGGSLAEVLECISDSDCMYIYFNSCLCQVACEKFIDCELFWYWGSTAECLLMCGMYLFEDEDIFYMFTCPLRFSSCLFIEDLCLVYLE
jgi:hypothetical protein